MDRRGSANPELESFSTPLRVKPLERPESFRGDGNLDFDRPRLFAGKIRPLKGLIGVGPVQATDNRSRLFMITSPTTIRREDPFILNDYAEPTVGLCRFQFDDRLQDEVRSAERLVQREEGGTVTDPL